MGNASVSGHRREDVESACVPVVNNKKVLLLGCGDTGKSTFFKQCKVLQNGFADEEREQFRDTIFGNILRAIKTMIEDVFENDKQWGNDYALLKKLHEMDSDVILNVQKVWSNELIDDIVTAFDNTQVQEVWIDRHKLCSNFLAGSLQHYMDKIEMMKNPKWIPTEEDVLYSQVKTTGIVETEIQYENTAICVIDTGGQRNERKKWVHCFEGVHCVVFTVSVLEYCMKMYEDDETNRAEESLMLFKEVVNSKWFTDIPFILVFTKSDLLCHTIHRQIFGRKFKDFLGNNNSCTDIIDFLAEKFMKQYEGDMPNKILPLVVNSIDTGVMSDALTTMAKVVVAGSTQGHTYKCVHKCKFYHAPLFTIAKMKRTKFHDLVVKSPQESMSNFDRHVTPRILKRVSERVIHTPISGAETDSDTESEDEVTVVDKEDEWLLVEEIPVEPVKSHEVTMDTVAMLPVVLDPEESKRQEIKKKSRQELERLVALMEKHKK